ncbi:sarcospan [Sitophilus oryzae]|uniref:Sarcospan n=1 Tax=Sitophilus oryzae TaxID=7048 RepID=A0A6J2YIT7_SITOR|nr:sarcospan [Sitophilus oryzae]
MENNNYAMNNKEQNNKTNEHTAENETGSSPALNTNHDHHIYNNLNGNNGNANGSLNNRLIETPNPTQVICLNTTVPQNIAARNLGDKHTPTRNSLRHSRMIVMNRHGKVPKKYLPLIIRSYKLVKSMKIVTILLGIALSILSVWFVLWTPTLTSKDYPYWSAVPIFFSGVIGCAFLGFCPRPYPGRKLGAHYHISKFASIVSTSVSIMAAIVVLILAVLHLLFIHSTTCLPHDKFNKTCVCSPNVTSSVYTDSYHYEDLSCDEVDVTLNVLLLVSCILNLIAIVLETFYLYVHWTSTRKYVYTKVPLKNSDEVTERQC